MRKIQTQAEIDKKKKKNQLLVGGVMIALLVFSVIGYSFASGDSNTDTSKVNEAGIDFFKQNGVWMADIDGSIFGFQNLPSEVSSIDVNTSINLAQYTGQPLYFVNPNEGINEVLSNVGNNILRYQEACLDPNYKAADIYNSVNSSEVDIEDIAEGLSVAFEDSYQFDCEGDLPVKSCNNNMIVFVQGNETFVEQYNGCIFIVGDSIKATDAFLYKALQVL